MPRHTDIYARADGLLASAERLLLEGGVRALTFRALARDQNMSLGSLADHYGSRRRLVGLLCHMAGEAWLKDLRLAVAERGVRGFLPGTAEDVRQARVWASWIELSRSDPELRGCVADLRLEERSLLKAAVGVEDEDFLDMWLAVIDGLRHRVIAPVDALPLARAWELLERLVPHHSRAA